MVNTTQSIAHSKDMLASLRDYWTHSLEGDTSWRKPTLFGESFGLTCISVAWFLTFLPKRRIRGWLLAGTLGLANLGEVFLVGMQQWRGVPSHLNNSTPFDSAVFLAMGFLILVTGMVILAGRCLSFLHWGHLRALPGQFARAWCCWLQGSFSESR